MLQSQAGYPQIEAAILKEVEKQKLVAHPPWLLKLTQVSTQHKRQNHDRAMAFSLKARIISSAKLSKYLC